MRGISEERLKKLLSEYIMAYTDRKPLQDLLLECQELNPWMPVPIKLPNEHERVLALFGDGSMVVTRMIDETCLSNDNLDYDYGFKQPTHWMPLQEGPK